MSKPENEIIEKKITYYLKVISVKNADGNYIPIIAANTQRKAFSAYAEWLKINETNYLYDVMNLSPTITLTPFYYEEQELCGKAKENP